jgi:hypothetical protein
VGGEALAVESAGGVEGPKGFVVPAELHGHRAEADMGLGLLRGEDSGLLVAASGLVPVTHGDVTVAELAGLFVGIASLAVSVKGVTVYHLHAIVLS